MTVAFRPAAAGDLAAIVALNDAAIPHVNALSDPVWLGFIAGHARVRVADRAGGGLAALTVTLPPGRAYGSENYAWFQRKLPDFAYVDRIVVAEGLRGRGVGRAAYADVFAAVGADGPPVVCEVNLDPPNDTSLAFHGSLGFRELAVQSVYGGTKRVAMLGRRADGIAEPSLAGPDDESRLRRMAASRVAAHGGGIASPADAIGVTAANDAGREQGTAIARAGRDGIGEIVALEVVSTLRGRGLGSRLLAALRREAKTSGWHGLAIADAPRDPAAARFLARNGFTAAGGGARLMLGGSQRCAAAVSAKFSSSVSPLGS